MKAAINARVSTHDQTTENQLLELRELAAHRGWKLVKEYTDEGISGAKGRDKRPGLDEMLKAASKHKFDIVMAWSVDRLGRSLPNLIATMQELEAANVNLYLHQQALDTTTDLGKAMFGMLGVFAEFERSMIRDRVKSGMARMKAEGRRSGPKGLAFTHPERYEEVKNLLLSGKTAWQVHKLTGTGHSTVINLKAEIDRGEFQQGVEKCT